MHVAADDPARALDGERHAQNGEMAPEKQPTEGLLHEEHERDVKCYKQRVDYDVTAVERTHRLVVGKYDVPVSERIQRLHICCATG